MLGYGMFVVEERSTGAFLGRVGPLRPPLWPAFEIAWSLATFPLEPVVSIIDPRNQASRRVAERLTGELFTPFRDPCDIWELRREDWPAA